MRAFPNTLPGVPDLESPLFDALFRSKDVSPQTLEVARTLRRDGYAVIDFPDPDFEAVSQRIIRTLDSNYDWDGWRAGSTPNLRVQDAWKTVPEVKQFACNAAILKLLSDLYGRRAFPFQTLNFPVGTQQHFHSDSVHFSSCPERFMVGVWLAFEDIDADNGPLVYYPGSHTLPIFTNEHVGKSPEFGAPNPYSNYPAYLEAWESIVEAQQLKPLYFYAKKGQALIWAANLLHGGAAQKDLNRTRYSQVTHYYFENCCYYTPLGSVPFLGHIQYRDVVDISTGNRVPNTINGVEAAPAARVAETKPSAPITPPTKVPPDFDGAAYLRANPDVAAARMDPAKHWLIFGYKEGRRLR